MSTQAQSLSNLRLQQRIAIVSALLMILKFVAYDLTHSVSILTDALESIVNTAAGFIGLYSLYVSAKPRDRDHPYGHGKAEFVSAAIEGTLVLAAGVLIIYSAVQKLILPPVIQQLDLGLLLIGITAVINWFMGWIALRQGRRNGSLALQSSGQHLQTDTYSTFAIAAGLVLLHFTGWIWIDSAVALIFGLYIIFIGYRIIRASLAGIMDEADMELLQRLVALLGKHRHPAWVDLHNLRVIKYGAVLHVDCHLTLPWYYNINEAHAEIDSLAELIRTHFGESLELFVHNDGCLYTQCNICLKDDCPVRQHPFLESIEWNLTNSLQNKKHEAADGIVKG